MPNHRSLMIEWCRLKKLRCESRMFCIFQKASRYFLHLSIRLNLSPTKWSSLWFPPKHIKIKTFVSPPNNSSNIRCIPAGGKIDRRCHRFPLGRDFPFRDFYWKRLVSHTRSGGMNQEISFAASNKNSVFLAFIYHVRYSYLVNANEHYWIDVDSIFIISETRKKIETSNLNEVLHNFVR